MLYTQTAGETTLEIIRTLLQDPQLVQFHLGGGTALALHTGHRQPEEITLFSPSGFDVRAMLEHLETKYGFIMEYQTENLVRGYISSAYLRVLTHDYPLVKDIVTEEGLRLYAMEDIAAMNIFAINGDRVRLVDFIDLFFLLDHFTMQEMLGFCKIKYDPGNLLDLLKSLTFFDNLPDRPGRPVVLTEKDLSLPEIKKKITAAVKKTVETWGV